jgi:hypothetical protein
VWIVQFEEREKLHREVSYQKMKKSLQMKAFVVWEALLLLFVALLVGWGQKRGIDIQLATAETALSFLHYITNLTNTNQTRLEINPPPAYQ